MPILCLSAFPISVEKKKIKQRIATEIKCNNLFLLCFGAAVKKYVYNTIHIIIIGVLRSVAVGTVQYKIKIKSTE